MSVFVRPREEVSVKIVLTLPEECNLGELMATMVDVVTMGGQKLRHQKVFVFGRAEVFQSASLIRSTPKSIKSKWFRWYSGLLHTRVK